MPQTLIAHKPQDSSLASATELICFILAYSELLLARWNAIDEKTALATQLVSLSRICELGVEDKLLRWMLYQGHIEHQRVVPGRGEGRFAVQPARTLRLFQSSFFSLTNMGEAFAENFLADTLVPIKEGMFEATWNHFCLGTLVPHYDKRNRLFTWGTKILKCFRQPAGNQELILCTAEELEWPEWFDDPLPRVPKQNPKARLRNSIKDLNRRQKMYLIHFKSDGTGTRIGWEYR